MNYNTILILILISANIIGLLTILLQHRKGVDMNKAIDRGFLYAGWFSMLGIATIIVIDTMMPLLLSAH